MRNTTLIWYLVLKYLNRKMLLRDSHINIFNCLMNTCRSTRHACVKIALETYKKHVSLCNTSNISNTTDTQQRSMWDIALSTEICKHKLGNFKYEMLGFDNNERIILQFSDGLCKSVEFRNAQYLLELHPPETLLEECPNSMWFKKKETQTPNKFYFVQCNNWKPLYSCNFKWKFISRVSLRI